MKKANKAKTYIGAAMIGALTTIFAVNTTHPDTAQPVIIQSYDGDKWELANSLNNGLFTNIHPSGDMVEDLAKFLLGQGGGKSRDPKDQITRLPNAWPPVADVDGLKYHTVHDITWVLFTNKRISAWVGYEPTAELFYAMPDSIRKGIIRYHVSQASATKSVCVNFVFTYALWGGGGYLPTMKRFELNHGDIDAAIDSSEYFVFYKCLVYRQQIMKERNAGVWNIYGRGWSNGLANFHRVFKRYCRTKPLTYEIFEFSRFGDTLRPDGNCVLPEQKAAA